MRLQLHPLLLAAGAVSLAACAADTTTSSRLASTMLANSLVSTPAGYSSLSSSYDASGDLGGAFMPEHDRGDHMGPMGGPMGHDHLGDGFMGGGLGPDFFGGIGFGRGFGRGPFGGDEDDLQNCSFDATAGVVNCTRTFRGLTAVSKTAFTDVNGKAQSTPDSTTNTVHRTVTVSGTITRRDSSRSTISSMSDRTITGLAAGSTQRTVDGTSAGTESTTGTVHDTAFTATRAVSDTTAGIVVPIQSGRPTYPTAGTVIRRMDATVTLQGQSPKSTARREVITYDGSNTAKVVITQDGTTKNCTMPLPRGHLTCQ